MIPRLILGEILITVKRKDSREALRILARLDVPFNGMSFSEISVSLYVPLYRKRQIERALLEKGIEIEFGRIVGAPAFFYRYRTRLGLLIGVAVVCVMLWMSQRVIWCVNVEGNYNVSDDEIISVLEELGCGVGDLYDKIDFDMLHNRFLMECRDISWIAVNMNGNHANVEVREVMEGEEKTEDGFYNIVAAESGQIERIAATEGKPVVEIYDTVSEGELLISGAISYKQDTMNRYESAGGSVYARVNRSFEIKIPIKYSEAVTTGEKITQKSLRFFKLRINLFRNSRIPYEVCDKINMYKQIYLFDSLGLPVWINNTEYKEVKMQETVLTEDTARQMAQSRYRDKLYEVLGDAEIISKSVSESFNGEEYTVTCELYCLADIAKKVPLILTENEK